MIKHGVVALGAIGMMLLGGCGAIDGHAVAADDTAPTTTTSSSLSSTAPTPDESTAAPSTPTVPFTGDPATVRCKAYDTYSEADQDRILHALKPDVPQDRAVFLRASVMLFCSASLARNDDPLVVDAFDINKFPQ